uniref:Uncharacterized protein n=1 Tax=Siphoviridae sp. ctIEo13 TaxID=2827833 RepID=A0A8S5TJI3_9CAUD|nr:MAG TPA: hypothetical protein [Siphoviridae sp. ctIEo13]
MLLRKAETIIPSSVSDKAHIGFETRHGTI